MDEKPTLEQQIEAVEYAKRAAYREAQKAEKEEVAASLREDVDALSAAGKTLLAQKSEEGALCHEILEELSRARDKFPGDGVTTLALVEEVGELATAMFSESSLNVRKEAIQVAVMAIRVILDGDATLDDWRKNAGLDPLVAKEGEKR